MADLLTTNFPTLTRPVVEAFVTALFSSLNDVAVFRGHCRDFLIRLKQFSGDDDEDDKDLFLHEAEAQQQLTADNQAAYMASVPGLTPQYESSRKVGEDAAMD